MPSITHPNDRPNYAIVSFPFGSVAFSYQTMIGFNMNGCPWVVCHNQWGPTTGKHLNDLEPNAKKRIPHSELEELFLQGLNNWAVAKTSSVLGLPLRLFDNQNV